MRGSSSTLRVLGRGTDRARGNLAQRKDPPVQGRAAELHDARLADIAVRYYAVAVPFVRWLNAALGYRAVARR